MSKLLIQEDWEREPTKELVYLYDQEHKLWLWWHHMWQSLEGEIVTEKLETEAIMEPKLPF